MAKLADGLYCQRRGADLLAGRLAPGGRVDAGDGRQARWVAAAESGTGSLLGAAVGRYAGAGQPLAADLLGCFGPGMVVLADRKFLSWSAARAFLATGAHLLWRARRRSPSSRCRS